MSKMKTACQEWVEKFVYAVLEIEPRAAFDDHIEDAYEQHEKHSTEEPAEVVKRMFGGKRTQYILGVNTPAWMVPGAEVPPGWRHEDGAWRND